MPNPLSDAAMLNLLFTQLDRQIPARAYLTGRVRFHGNQESRHSRPRI